jgi:hypothetical protein
MGGGFRYTNCLGRGYDSRVRQYDAVGFAINQAGTVLARLCFPAPVTEEVAVRAAERYFSAPLSEKDYLRAADGLPGPRTPWATAREEYVYRGDCLRAATSLTAFSVEAAVGGAKALMIVTSLQAQTP